METKPSFNFKNHQSKKFSRWYLLRVVMYIVLLGISMILLVKRYNQKPVEQPYIKEIRGLEVEVD